MNNTEISSFLLLIPSLNYISWYLFKVIIYFNSLNFYKAINDPTKPWIVIYSLIAFQQKIHVFLYSLSSWVIVLYLHCHKYILLCYSFPSLNSVLQLNLRIPHETSSLLFSWHDIFWYWYTDSTVWYWHKERNRSMEQNRKPRNKPGHTQITDIWRRWCSGENIPFSTAVMEKLNILMQNKLEFIHYTIWKINPKRVTDLNVKLKTMTLQGENICAR